MLQRSFPQLQRSGSLQDLLLLVLLVRGSLLVLLVRGSLQVVYLVHFVHIFSHTIGRCVQGFEFTSDVVNAVDAI